MHIAVISLGEGKNRDGREEEEIERKRGRKKGKKSRPGTNENPRSKEKPSLKGRKEKREKTGRKHCRIRNRVATCDVTINKLDPPKFLSHQPD